jgi:cellulose synthase (UDP-forming)
LVWVAIDLALLASMVRAARYQGPGDTVQNPVAAAVTTEVNEVIALIESGEPAERLVDSAHTRPLRAVARKPLALNENGHLCPAAYFDAVAALALRANLSDATQYPAVVLIDVSRVRVVTPSAVAATLDLMRMVRARGGDLRIFGASQSFTMAHDTMSLNHVTRLHGDHTEASSPRQPVHTRRAIGSHRRERARAS